MLLSSQSKEIKQSMYAISPRLLDSPIRSLSSLSRPFIRAVRITTRCRRELDKRYFITESIQVCTDIFFIWELLSERERRESCTRQAFNELLLAPMFDIKSFYGIQRLNVFHNISQKLSPTLGNVFTSRALLLKKIKPFFRESAQILRIWGVYGGYYGRARDRSSNSFGYRERRTRSRRKCPHIRPRPVLRFHRTHAVKGICFIKLHSALVVGPANIYLTFSLARFINPFTSILNASHNTTKEKSSAKHVICWKKTRWTADKMLEISDPSCLGAVDNYYCTRPSTLTTLLSSHYFPSPEIKKCDKKVDQKMTMWR